MANKLLLPTHEEFPSQPNQPTNITFPKRMFSGKLCSFQPSWFTMCHWLHYDPSKDTAFCHTCITGLLLHKMKATSVEPAFVSTYYIIIGYRVKIIQPRIGLVANYRQDANASAADC